MMNIFAYATTVVLILVSLLFSPVSAKSETAYIVASKDNTLIQNSSGDTSNGSGPYIFAGRTNQQANSLRRGIVHFDVASALPAGARIKNTQLLLYLSKGQNVISEIRLHRVLSDWGQGLSYATGGSGAPAELDDATWLNTFYPDLLWTSAGGDYVMSTSAALAVGPDNGTYTWESKIMVEDAQLWLMNPAENFGWMLIGDENTPQSVVAFSSREVMCSDRALSTEIPPILVVDYK